MRHYTDTVEDLKGSIRHTEWDEREIKGRIRDLDEDKEKEEILLAEVLRWRRVYMDELNRLGGSYEKQG